MHRGSTPPSHPIEVRINSVINEVMTDDAPTSTFITDEIIAASGFARATVEMFVKLNISPESEGGRRGSARRWPLPSLVMLIVAGALHKGGMEPVNALKLGRVLYGELAQKRGYVPDSLDELFRHIGLELLPNASANERFALYCAARTAGVEAEHLLNPSAGDQLVEIADRAFVLAGIAGPLDNLFPICRITQLERGADEVTFLPAADEISSRLAGLDMKTDEGLTLRREIEEQFDTEFRRARDLAVSVLRVNLGTAIRRGFEAVCAFREEPKIRRPRR